jgi:hypothetical protein
MAVRFTGARELEQMSRQLQTLAVEMQREVESAMADELEALQPKLRRSAMDTLPTRGGLDRKIAASAMKVTKLGGMVTLRAISRANIRNMNKGFLFHPVFARGDRSRSQWKWVRQTVRPGWFEQPTQQSEARLRRAIDQAMRRAIRRVR